MKKRDKRRINTKQFDRFNKKDLWMFVAVFGFIGLLTLIFTKAAVPFIDLAPENGTITSPAAKVADSGAAGGEALKFGTGPTQFTSQCLARTGTKITLSGLRKSDYKNYSLPTNTIIDATNLVWDGTDSAGDPISWLIGVGGVGPSCWYGAKWTGIWDDTDPAVTWQEPYHHSAVMTIRGSDFLVEGIKATNQGDGIRMEGGGSDFHIRGVYLTDMHDDCIENDFLHSGIIEDSFFNGCYTGISADDFTRTLDGSANTMTMRNNLMYIKPMNTVYRGPSPGTGVFFKGWWQTPSPKVSFTNNIIRFDSDSGFASLDLPDDLVFSNCSNNTIVWTGSGPFPSTTYPSCFTVTTNISVWNNAVNQWKGTHTSIANR